LQDLDYNPNSPTHCCGQVGQVYHDVITFNPSINTPVVDLCCTEGSDSDCCNAVTGYEWNDVTKTCDEKCPCEGCCDYNCCDELDYFLHKAFEEMYSDSYSGDFDSFYADWFGDFYTWWYNGDLTTSS